MTTSEPSEGVPLRHDPLWRRHERRLQRGGFRTVQLNAVGWAALVGAGLVFGTLIALVSQLPPALALPLGVVLTWAGLLVADYVRWRNGTVGMGFEDLDADTGAAIVAELERLGIDASYREHRFDDEDEPAGYVQRNIECRNADAEKVRQVMEAKLRKG